MTDASREILASVVIDPPVCDEDHRSIKVNTSTWRKATEPLPSEKYGPEWNWINEKTQRRYQSRNCLKCQSTVTAEIDGLGRVVRRPVSNQTLIGKRFNKLVVVELLATSVGNKGPDIKVKCDCGREKAVRLYHVKRNMTTSCGTCGFRIIKTHGMTNSKEFYCWHNMRMRCTWTKSSVYKYYGGRGITVCDRWLYSFDNFFTDMGPMPTGHSIERKDVNGNYEPGNCVWIPKFDQGFNRRNTRIIEANGVKDSIAGWSRRTGLTIGSIWARLKMGWSHLDAVTKPRRVMKAPTKAAR